MILFPDKIRTDLTYASPNESSYSFLNRCGLEEFGVVREKLNRWFDHYPESEQYELKKRLQSKEQFHDTFFEVYVHEFFYSRGFKLSVHPLLEHTTKQPDFLVLNVNEPSFYLEAKVVHDESDEEREYKKKQDKIVHEIDKLGNFPYWVSIRELKIKNRDSFSLKPVIRKIEAAAKSFDYLQMMQNFEKPTLSYEDDNLSIEFSFFTRSSSRIEGLNRPVGVRAYFDACCVNTHELLYKAIKEKARKYGKTNLPLVIAINYVSTSLLSEDDLELLIGKDLQFVKSNKPLKQIDRKPFNEGIFSKRFMEHVAALFIIWVTPYHQDDEQWYCCENPNFIDKKFQESLINQVLD